MLMSTIYIHTYIFQSCIFVYYSQSALQNFSCSKTAAASATTKSNRTLSCHTAASEQSAKQNLPQPPSHRPLTNAGVRRLQWASGCKFDAWKLFRCTFYLLYITVSHCIYVCIYECTWLCLRVCVLVRVCVCCLWLKATLYRPQFVSQ